MMFLIFKKRVTAVGGFGGVSKKLLDLTNAYLAIEALLESRFLSDETRNQLQETLKALDQEAKALTDAAAAGPKKDAA